MLIAMGLTLIFSIMSLINFAHGEFYMLGGFALYWFFGQFGVNYWLSLVIGMILVGLFGILTERFIFRPLRKDMLQACLASVGVSIVLQTGALAGFGQCGTFAGPGPRLFADRVAGQARTSRTDCV